MGEGDDVKDIEVLVEGAGVRTALEANAWTYGLEPDEMRKLEVRT